MIADIKITDISILDKKMLLDAVDNHGKNMMLLYTCEPLRHRRLPKLMEYGICQDAMVQLTKQLNKPKVWGMNQTAQLVKDKKWDFPVAIAVMLLSALNEYRSQCSDYELARIDQMYLQIHKQITAI